MPMIPATRIEMTLGMLSQESRSRVRGREKMKVGMAKMPVYSIRHSWLFDKMPRAIWPASSCPPVAKIAKMIVPALNTSRPIGPARMYPASPMLWTVQVRIAM